MSVMLRQPPALAPLTRDASSLVMHEFVLVLFRPRVQQVINQDHHMAAIAGLSVMACLLTREATPGASDTS